MAVTTRSQNRKPYNLLPISKNAKSRLPSKPSTKKASRSIQNPVAFKEPRKAKGVFSSSQKPQERPRKHQSSDKSEQPQITTELSWPDLSDGAITHWACRDCSCSQGAFDNLVDSCIRCGHKMEDHENINPDWDPKCDYVCERKGLVTSIMRLLEVMRVVIIRATPQSGKSVLLHLLGHHACYNREDLEPVFIHWRSRAERDNLPYAEYLEQEKSWWRGRNSKHRPSNPRARPLYLIDEGQGSYEECDLWARDFKNRGTRSQPMFVVVCLYGVDVSISRPHGIESQSLNISPVQRVELRPSSTKNPHILFTLEETTVMVRKWATYSQYELSDDLYEYLHTATDGHPGMVGFVLQYFDDCVSKV